MLPLVMVFGEVLVILVALATVQQARVIKGDLLLPIGGVGVTVHTHGRSLPWRKIHAWLAHRAPRQGYRKPSVLGRRQVMVRWAVLHVAGATLDHLCVLVTQLLPIGDAGVTRLTRAGIVIRWGVIHVTRVAFDDALVIERKGLPHVRQVTVLTIAGKMVGVERVGAQLVAIGAPGWRAGIQSVLVTGGAFCREVFAAERVGVVV